MPKSTKNMDLVPQDALRQLMELDAQLETTKNNLRELLVPVVQVSNELQKSATNYKTLTDLINKLNVAEKAAGDTYKEQKKVIGDLEKAKDNLAKASREEAKEIDATDLANSTHLFSQPWVLDQASDFLRSTEFVKAVHKTVHQPPSNQPQFR